MTDLTTARLQAALVAACDAVIGARDELGRLDAQAGDGDLGSTLAGGFTSVRALLIAEPRADVGALLGAVAGELGRKAPSTMGSLLSAALRRAAKGAAGLDAIDARGYADLLATASAQVQSVGGAVEGQRSVVDAMEPSARAAAERAGAGGSVEATARAAADAAWAGARATAAMEPQVGRAAWVGGRAMGLQDGGATAWAIILEAVADALEAGA